MPNFKEKSWRFLKRRRSREKLTKRQRAKYRPKSKLQSRRKSNCENRSFRKRKTRLELRRRGLKKWLRERRWRPDLVIMCQYQRGESRNNSIKTPSRNRAKRRSLKAHLLKRFRRHQFKIRAIILLPSLSRIRRLSPHRTLRQSLCRISKYLSLWGLPKRWL